MGKKATFVERGWGLSLRIAGMSQSHVSRELGRCRRTILLLIQEIDLTKRRRREKLEKGEVVNTFPIRQNRFHQFQSPVIEQKPVKKEKGGFNVARRKGEQVFQVK